MSHQPNAAAEREELPSALLGGEGRVDVPDHCRCSALDLFLSESIPKRALTRRDLGVC